MTHGTHLFRSCLYMPADNEKLLAKSSGLQTDCVIFDLEDAVAPEQKATAREMLGTHLKTFDQSQKPTLIRINALNSMWCDDDIKAVAAMPCLGVVIPKIETPEQIFMLQEKLKAAGASKELEIWAMVETAASIADAFFISASAKKTRLTTFIFGTNDLAKETGAPLIKGRENMMPWLAQATISAKAHGLRVIDSVMQDFGDMEGLKQECHQAIGLGMDGKSLIHPKQLEITNKTFAPQPDEVDWCRKIVETFETPENSNKAVIKIDNKMVEQLHFEMAKALLARHEKISTKGF